MRYTVGSYPNPINVELDAATSVADIPTTYHENLGSYPTVNDHSASFEAEAAFDLVHQR